MPHGQVAVDIGGGLGHIPDPDGRTGFGLNLELKAGVGPGLELGIRTGIRADDAGRATQADRYARPFDTETYGTNFDTVANPELHLEVGRRPRPRRRAGAGAGGLPARSRTARDSA